MTGTLLEGVQAKIRGKDYGFTLHAGRRMTERHIAVREVEEAILGDGVEVIEDYPDDPRGPSCLLLGVTSMGRRLHVQCTYPPNVAVITVYEPEFDEWVDGRVRKRDKP